MKYVIFLAIISLVSAAKKYDISRVYKVPLLHELWNIQKPASYFDMNRVDPPEFDVFEAGRVVLEYIDYFCGRAIKTNISGDVANTDTFDEYAGAGSFERAVARTWCSGYRVATVDCQPYDEFDCSNDYLYPDNAPPKEYVCPDGSGKFRSSRELMIDGDPGSELCGNCPYMLKQHIQVH